ncbi:contact-dependent growth inhibition system immunity protein [Streptomyces werraensis]|uniref:contact-dependent growth inhibition system immunity protein n=1 Tax=Streptomyces werraensis TaxID=68284 RepID=UPI0037D1B814
MPRGDRPWRGFSPAARGEGSAPGGCCAAGHQQVCPRPGERVLSSTPRGPARSRCWPRRGDRARPLRSRAFKDPHASQPVDPTQSLERLEGQRWPEPREDATSLVRAVHELRRRPVGHLRSDELARLITQDVGLPWLLPLAVRILRDTAPSQVAGGWYDDDLLYAVVTRKTQVWETVPGAGP